eukprot:356323-Chlamydomonas_euryale.AAC.12
MSSSGGSSGGSSGSAGAGDSVSAAGTCRGHVCCVELSHDVLQEACFEVDALWEIEQRLRQQRALDREPACSGFGG